MSVTRAEGRRQSPDTTRQRRCSAAPADVHPVELARWSISPDVELVPAPHRGVFLGNVGYLGQANRRVAVVRCAQLEPTQLG
jgi:hypothetical protein